MDETERAHREWWQSWRRLTRFAGYLDPDSTAGRRDRFGPALAEVDEFRRLDDAQRAAIDRWVQSWIAVARLAGSATQLDAGERLLFSVPEAAKVLGVSRGLAYQAITAGRIRTVLIGTRRLVPKTELLRLAAGADDEVNVQG